MNKEDINKQLVLQGYVLIDNLVDRRTGRAAVPDIVKDKYFVNAAGEVAYYEWYRGKTRICSRVKNVKGVPGAYVYLRVAGVLPQEVTGKSAHRKVRVRTLVALAFMAYDRPEVPHRLTYIDDALSDDLIDRVENLTWEPTVCGVCNRPVTRKHNI